MRVITTQEQTFADRFVNIPSSKLDIVNKIIHWQTIAKQLKNINVDYAAVSLFKALLIGTWHNLSDERLADSLNRDLVFISFCGFSLSGNKPDATTLLRFRNKLVQQNLFDPLLALINTMLEDNQPKLANGKHVAMDATLIQRNKLRNKAISKRRFVVERTFGTLKRTYGLSRSRYRSLEKVASEVNLKAIAYNLTRAVNVYKARWQPGDYCV